MKSLDAYIDAAKKDPRMKKMRGEDTEDMDESKDEDTSDDEDSEDGLGDVFSTKQASAIRAYVESCK